MSRVRKELVFLMRKPDMWLIRNYYHDLTEFFGGDEGRFTRMVGSGGRQFETASPQGWAKHIVNCTTVEVLAHYRAEIEKIYRQLRAWGLPVPQP